MKFFSKLAVAFCLTAAATAGPARAQSDDCARLAAAIDAPTRGDPAAAAAARKSRADYEKLAGYAHSIGCDNQQFLFFGQAPPPQCGGLKARIAGLRAQTDALESRASGDGAQKRALIARYEANCRPQAPRQKGFFETLFGGRDDSAPQGQPGPDGAERVDGQGIDEGQHARGGGSQALCVRTCDGGFFPLPISARSAGANDLLELCKALCPNAEVQLFTRAPGSDISSAVGALDGEAYEDLPNALKYAKKYDPACGCKPPNQNWVEALAHAEELLDEMGGAKASDATITEQQSQAMMQGTPVKPGKKAKGAPPAAPAQAEAPKPSDAVGAIPEKPAPKSRTVEVSGPDGEKRSVRVVGPSF